ncbi:DUF308 domain-containing protein [Pseudoruegeria sp. SHC-113]|uniref:DUF308 domain-containing protein n=1 Tax=Pseudoruegeria sp. SHC-113 TaxID=2855439 RepID=UPI0021BB2B86|nr:DUF308 domain-containing protein [Pseudoruegeria sp. SHC-113]MCT8158872.1 DUF308 domain-containing protein [Pseudoruegeria sp. SHC-113]
MAETPKAETRKDFLLAALASHSGFFTLQAVIMLAAGAFAAAYPLVAGPLDTTIIAWLLFLYAATLLVGLVLGKRMRGAVMQILTLLFALLAGFVILIQLVEAAGLSIYLIGLFLVAEGAARLRQGLGLRPEASWALLALGGVIPLTAGIFLIAQPAAVSGTTLGLLLGISLIASGLGLLLAVRNARAAPNVG